MSAFGGFDLVLGATMLNLTERPLTNKINAGDEPISNTIWGIDGIYQKDSPFLTKLIDNIPLIETKSNKETILSAGSIGSPHILQVSGVGDSNKLKSYGVIK